MNPSYPRLRRHLQALVSWTAPVVRGLKAVLVASACTASAGLSAAAAAEAAPPNDVGRPLVSVQTGHAWKIAALAYSPDGRSLATSSLFRGVVIWDAASGRERLPLRTESSSLAFSPDGRFLFSGGAGPISIWDASSGTRLHETPTRTYFSKLALSADGRTLAAVTDSGVVRVFDVTAAPALRPRRDLADKPAVMAFSPDGSLLASGTFDGMVRLWETASGRLRSEFRGHAGAVSSLAFSPDGAALISAGRDKTLQLWNAGSGRLAGALPWEGGSVEAVAFSRDGKTLAAGGDTAHVMVRGWPNGGAWRRMPTPGGVTALAFAPGDALLAIGDFKGDIRIVALDSGRAVQALVRYGSWQRAVAFSGDGKTLVSAGNDRLLRSWDLATGQQLRIFAGHESTVRALAVSPDGTQVASASEDRTVRLWDLSGARPVAVLRGHTGPVLALAFSPDGTTLATLSMDRTVRLWAAAGGQLRATLAGYDGAGASSIAFSPDGRYLAAAGGTGEQGVRIWEAASARLVRELPAKASALAFSPDGRTLALGEFLNAANSATLLRLWDVTSGSLLRSVATDGMAIVYTLAFAPGGASIAFGGADGQLRVVDLASGQWRRIDGEHFGSVFGVAFSPDGGLLASASADGRLRLSRASSFATVLDFYPIVTADGPDWLSITPEGYFATNSGEAAEAINVRVGGRVQRLDQFYDVFYRPDIVMRKVRGDDISSLVTQSLADAAQKRPPRLTALRLAAAGMPARDIDVTSPQAQADVGSVPATGTVSVSFEYAAEGAGIGEVRVFHNGKLVSSDGSHRLDAATGIAKAVPAQTRDAAAKADRSGDVVTIAPVAGENVVSVLAFDRSNSLRSAIRSVRFVADRAQSAPRLYTVVVGVDRYRDTTIPRLALAVKDATDFARTLASRTRGTFGALQVEAPVLLFDGDATRANILQAIERVASRMQPQDTFVWYVAGHGILEQSMYVLVPHDFDQARIMESGLNGNDLLRIAQRVPALQQVFVLDTCHAGGVDRVVGALYDARMTVLARKMGLHLMAGATDVQNALDKGPKGSNGLFTESILDAMEGPGADEDSDGLIQVNELARFATRVTQEKARKLGHAQDPVSVNVGRDFAITRAAR